MLFLTNSYVFSIANLFWLVTYEFVVLNLYLKTYKFVVFSRPYPLVWAEPKTIATSTILDLIKFVLYHFTMKTPCFHGTNRKLLKRAF